MLSNKYCNNCYHFGSCENDEACEDYTPIDDQYNDKDIDNIIEANRIAFHAEWVEYIDDRNG